MLAAVVAEGGVVAAGEFVVGGVGATVPVESLVAGVRGALVGGGTCHAALAQGANMMSANVLVNAFATRMRVTLMTREGLVEPSIIKV